MSESRRQIVEQLRDAERSQLPVRIERDKLDADFVYGFVASVAERWVAIQTLDGAVYLDGYEVVRIKHVTYVEQDQRAPYIERALAKLGRPNFDLQLLEDVATRDVLIAAANRAKLVTVHFEKEEGEPMWVGHLDRLDEKTFDLHFIDWIGEWDPEPRRAKYKDVTRVQIGDRYSMALDQFGEERPVD